MVAWIATLVFGAIPMFVRFSALSLHEGSIVTFDNMLARPEPFAFALVVASGTAIRLVDRVVNIEQEFLGGSKWFALSLFSVVLLSVITGVVYAMIVNEELACITPPCLSVSVKGAYALGMMGAAFLVSLAPLARKNQGGAQKA
jgi:hypothetical protein